MEYFVYIVMCSDGTLYTGITTDIKRRIKEHNESNKSAKYTKIRRPVVLVFNKKCQNRSEATQEELKIKKLTRTQKNSLINNQ